VAQQNYGGVSFPSLSNKKQVSISDLVRGKSAPKAGPPTPPARPTYANNAAMQQRYAAPSRYVAPVKRYVAPPQPVIRYSVSDRVRQAQAKQKAPVYYTVQRPTYAAPTRRVVVQQPVYEAPAPPPPPPKVQAPTYQGNTQQYQPAGLSAMRQVNAPELVAYGDNRAKLLGQSPIATDASQRSVRRPTPPPTLSLVTPQGTRSEPLPQLVPSVKYAANVGPLAANVRAVANAAAPVVSGAARSLWQQLQADNARPDTRPDLLRTALTPVSRAVGSVVGRALGGTAGLGAQVGLTQAPPTVTNLNPVAPRVAPGSPEDIANFWQQRGAIGGTLQLSQRPYQIVAEPLLGAAWERQVTLEQAQAQGYNNLLAARRGQSSSEALAKAKEILGAYRGPTSEADIARYRQEAPAVTQFLMGLAFDPLTYTDALTSLPFDAVRAFKAGSKVIDLPLGIHLAGNLAPSMGTVNGVRRVLTAEEVAAETPIAAAKVRSLVGRLNPFQPTPLSLVNSLAKESSDMTTRLMEATVAQADNFGGDQFGLFKAALANPDAPEVVRATAGLSQSRPFKRTIMVARRTLGSWDDPGVAAYVAKTGKAEAVAVDLAARAAKQAAIAQAALAADKTGLAQRAAYTAEQLKRLEDVRLAAQTTAEQAAAEVAQMAAAGKAAEAVATARKVADDAALVAEDVAKQVAAQQARYATPMSKAVDLTFQKAEALAVDAAKARSAVVARQATTPAIGSFDTDNIFKLIERATDPVSGQVDDIAAVADLARQYEDATTSFFATKKVNKAGQEVWDYGATDLTKGAKWLKDNVNNVLSTVYMGYNPGYAWRNAANNLITALADGVTPFQSSDNIRQLWTRWGLPPIGTKQGIGAAGDVWKSRESAAEFTRELLQPYRLRDTFKGVTFKAPTLKLGQNFESYASERIMAHHLRNFWQQTWPRAVRKISDGNLDAFRAIGLTSEQIELRVKLAALAMSPDELREALVYGTMPGTQRLLPPSAGGGGGTPIVRPPGPPSVRVPPVVKPGAVERAVITDAAQLLPDAVIEDARKLAGDEFVEAIQQAAATPHATPIQRAALVKIEFAKVDTATATRDASAALDALERATNPQDVRSAEDLLSFLGEVDRITAAHIDANDAILDDLWQTTKGLTPQQRKGAWAAYWQTFRQQLDGFHVQLKALDEEVMPDLGFTRKAIERQEARRLVTRQTWDAYTKKLKATWADSDKFAVLDPARDAVWAEFKTWRKGLWDKFNANQAERMTLRQNDIDVAYLNLRKRNGWDGGDGGGGGGAAVAAAPPPKSPASAAVQAAPSPVTVAEAMPNGMDAETWNALNSQQRQELKTLLNDQRLALQVPDVQQTVPGFVSRMLRREDLTADADAAFYAANVDAINAELTRVQSPRPAAVAQAAPVVPQVVEQVPVKAASAAEAVQAAPPVVPVAAPAALRTPTNDELLAAFKSIGKENAVAQANFLNSAAGLNYKGTPQEIGRHLDLNLLDEPEKRNVMAAISKRASGETPPTPKLPAKQAVAALVEEVKPTVPALDWIPTNDVLLDPTRFQFKLDVKSKGGATGSLADVQTWDDNLGAGVGVWREPETGKIWVVDGHNRVVRAQQLGIDRLKAPVFFEVPTAAAARLVGALRNIANGKGTPIDAAKLFREAGFTADLLAARGLSLKDSFVRKGLALANLNDTLFAAVIRKELPIERAVIIGERVPDHDLQMKLVQELDKRLQRGKTVTDPMVAELADMLTTGPQATVVQETLFGAEEVMQSFALEKADFYAYVRENLAKEKRLFGGVAKNADDLQRVGTIDKAAATEISDVARQNIDLFDTFKNQVGPISQLGDEAAEALAKGGNANAIKSAYYQRVIDALPDAARNAFAPTSGDVAGAAGSAVVRGAAGEAEPSLFGLADEAATEVAPPLTFDTPPPGGNLGIVAPGMAGPAGPPPATPAAIFRDIRDALNQPARPIPPATPAQMAALKDLALNKYIPAMTRDKAMVNDLATTMRNFALGDYAHKRNIHEWLSYLYPYSYWYTFTYWNWMQRLLQHPAYLSNYARYRALLHEANVARYREEMGDPNATLPPDWEGTIDVPFAGRLNPERTLMPLNALVESMRSKVKEAVPAIGPFPSGKTLETLTDWGPNIWSPIIYAYGALLEQAGYKEAAEEWVGNLLPQTQPFKSATALWKEAGLPGADKIPAGGVNIEAFRRPDGTIWEQRRIPKFLADLVDKGEITQEEAAKAAYKRAGDAWEQAQQAEAVARAPGNLSSFLIGQGFKPRSAADILINEAYTAKAALNAKQDSLTEEQFFDELGKFYAKYPWYKTYYIGREYDPTARLVAYAKLVFERLPIGKAFTRGLAAGGLTPEQYNRFKADAKAHGWNAATGKDDAENTFANWTPEEVAAFTIAVEKMGDTLKVFTPAEKAEIEAGRDAHAAAQQGAVGNDSVRQGLTDLGVAGAGQYGDLVGLSWLKQKEQQYYAIPETEKEARAEFLTQYPELKRWWNDTKVAERDTAAAEFYITPKDDFWYFLPPGSRWQDAVDMPEDIKALLDKAYGGKATDAEYTVVAAWLQKNLPPEWQDRKAFTTARQLNDQFEAAVLQKFGADILDWSRAYGAAGDKAAKAAWKAAHPKEYAALLKFWNFKRAFGPLNPDWEKFYGFADSTAKARSYGSSGSSYYPRRSYTSRSGRRYYTRYKKRYYSKKRYYTKRRYYTRRAYARRGYTRRSYSSGGGGSGSSGGGGGGGSAGGGSGTFPSPTPPVTTAPPWQAMKLTDFNTALAALRTKNPQLDAVIGKLFGADVLSDLLAYLALSDADRKLWLADPQNRDLVAALTKFFAWFAELNVKGAGQDTRILGSIPGATPPPPGLPKFNLPTPPLPPAMGVNTLV
jgi:hypothetical protein